MKGNSSINKSMKGGPLINQSIQNVLYEIEIPIFCMWNFSEFSEETKYYVQDYIEKELITS